jgi:GNAT superfamily N-acetyltransferase
VVSTGSPGSTGETGPAGATVRVAGWADREVVAGLRRAWTEEYAGRAVDDACFQQRFDEWLEREQDQRVTWLGSVDGDPVAMLNLLVFTRMPRPGQERPNRWGYLANFFVRPEHRAGGLGSRMLATCTAYADEHGFARVVLSPSERSVPLYTRGGFEPATSLMVRSAPDRP